MSRDREPGEDDELPWDRQQDGRLERQCDLSQFDDAFAAAPSSTRDPVPDGLYRVRITRVVMTTSKRSGQPMMSWTMRILGPDPRFVGRLLWRHNVFTPAQMRFLKADLQACGVELARLSDLQLSDLVDLELEVRKRTRGDRDSIYINGLAANEEDHR